MVRGRPRRSRCGLPLRRRVSSEPSGGSHESGFGRLSPICRDEVAVGSEGVLGVDDGLGAAPEEFRAVRAKGLGELVEMVDEVVVELNEHFTSSHEHMITHMQHATARQSSESGERILDGLMRS